MIIPRIPGTKCRRPTPSFKNSSDDHPARNWALPGLIRADSIDPPVPAQELGVGGLRLVPGRMIIRPGTLPQKDIGAGSGLPPTLDSS